jgi:hypothetical protein
MVGCIGAVKSMVSCQGIAWDECWPGSLVEGCVLAVAGCWCCRTWPSGPSTIEMRHLFFVNIVRWQCEESGLEVWTGSRLLRQLRFILNWRCRGFTFSGKLSQGDIFIFRTLILQRKEWSQSLTLSSRALSLWVIRKAMVGIRWDYITPILKYLPGSQRN